MKSRRQRDSRVRQDVQGELSEEMRVGTNDVSQTSSRVGKGGVVGEGGGECRRDEEAEGYLRKVGDKS